MNVKINGNDYPFIEGSTVAALIMSSDLVTTGLSVKGKPRAPLCGMGICHECRVTIDGLEYERSCMVLCRDGMEIEIT